MEERKNGGTIMPPDRYVIYQEFRGQVQQVSTCSTEADPHGEKENTFHGSLIVKIAIMLTPRYYLMIFWPMIGR